MPRRRSDRRLIWFLADNAAIGVLVAAVVTYALVKLDALGLASLAERSSDGWLALLLLFFGLAVTFASLAMGTAIFLLPKDKDRWR
jgi:Zn-dependent protease with chaperone function